MNNFTNVASVNSNEIPVLKQTFDSIKHIDENGNGYWSSRELSEAMGYSRYRNFESAIDRAKESMKSSGKNPEDHLAQSRQMIEIGKGAIRETEDFHMDRYASYLTAMNADPNKTEVAFAQQYFLDKTATAETLEKRFGDIRRLQYRDLNSRVNKKLAATIVDHDVPSNKVGVVLSKGDEGFFGAPTQDIKRENNIPQSRPLVDYLDDDALAYKAVAQVESRHEIERNDSRGIEAVSQDVYNANADVRERMIQKIDKLPEKSFTSDIKKVEKNLNKTIETNKKDLLI